MNNDYPLSIPLEFFLYGYLRRYCNDSNYDELKHAIHNYVFMNKVDPIPAVDGMSFKEQCDIGIRRFFEFEQEIIDGYQN